MEIKDQIQKLVQANYSLAAIARACDVNAGALSSYMLGNYPGNVEKIEKKLISFLDRQSKKFGTANIDFIATSVSEKIYEVADVVRAEQEIGVVCGDAGIGKTFALKKYIKDYPDVIFIEVDFGYTAQFLFAELYQKLGLGDRGMLSRIVADCVRKLSGTERTIVVDEAEYLPHKALDLLRRLHDKAGVGILLCGLPRLLHNLRGSHGEYAQLFSRVGVCRNLGNLTSADSKKIVEHHVPEANGEWQYYHRASRGNARVMSKLIKRTLRTSKLNDQPINQKLIAEAARGLIY